MSAVKFPLEITPDYTLVVEYDSEDQNVLSVTNPRGVEVYYDLPEWMLDAIEEQVEKDFAQRQRTMCECICEVYALASLMERAR